MNAGSVTPIRMCARRTLHFTPLGCDASRCRRSAPTIERASAWRCLFERHPRVTIVVDH